MVEFWKITNVRYGFLLLLFLDNFCFLNNPPKTSTIEYSSSSTSSSTSKCGLRRKKRLLLQRQRHGHRHRHRHTTGQAVLNLTSPTLTKLWRAPKSTIKVAKVPKSSQWMLIAKHCNQKLTTKHCCVAIWELFLFLWDTQYHADLSSYHWELPPVVVLPYCYHHYHPMTGTIMNPLESFHKT